MIILSKSHVTVMILKIFKERPCQEKEQYQYYLIIVTGKHLFKAINTQIT